MSEKRFSGWTVLLIVALVLAVSGVAVAGGAFVGFKFGRATASWSARARGWLPAPYFERRPDGSAPRYYFGMPHRYDRSLPEGPPHRFEMPGPGRMPYHFGMPPRFQQPPEEAVPEQPDRPQAAQPFLGVIFEPVTPALAEQRDLPVEQGALIVQVIEDSPAEQAGLRVDDVVVAVEGRRITADRTLADLILAYAPGDQVELEVRRGPRRLTLEVELAERPADLPTGRLRQH